MNPTFRDAMEQALYGPDGYYSAGHARTGRTGDYFTAPETGAAFGRLLKTIFRDWLARLGAKAPQIVEVGAGEGHLAALGVPTVAVERSLARRQRIAARDASIRLAADLAQLDPFEGVLFGNELIDAFPVHRVRMRSGVLEERYAQGAWGAPSTPQLAAYFKRLRVVLPDGYETEVNLEMADWLRDASRVLKKGLLVLIDYGRPAWDYYAEERNGGTLRCFGDHRVFDPFKGMGPGLQPAGATSFALANDVDWTSDVDFTSLALDAKTAGFSPLAFLEMGTFLKEGLRPDDPPNGLRYLLHPDGLGAQFHVLILGKDIDPAAWTFAHNRLARLGLPA